MLYVFYVWYDGMSVWSVRVLCVFGAVLVCSMRVPVWFVRYVRAICVVYVCQRCVMCVICVI